MKVCFSGFKCDVSCKRCNGVSAANCTECNDGWLFSQ